MKKLLSLSFVLIGFIACKSDPKVIIVNKWVYDLDEMYKVTEKNLAKLETRDQIMKSYKDVYLNTYKGVSYDLDKSGKLIWDDHGVVRNGTWGLADNDSTLIIKADSVEVNFKILELSSKKMVFQDNVVNTSPQFQLSKPILKASK
jgi:hypothetical protein